MHQPSLDYLHMCITKYLKYLHMCHWLTYVNGEESILTTGDWSVQVVWAGGKPCCWRRPLRRRWSWTVTRSHWLQQQSPHPLSLLCQPSLHAGRPLVRSSMAESARCRSGTPAAGRGLSSAARTISTPGTSLSTISWRTIWPSPLSRRSRRLVMS